MAGDCASDDCPVKGGFYNYQPSREGNGVILGFFALLVPVTLVLGFRFKTPAFASTLATGILLEVLGFAGRVMLYDNVADKSQFALSLLGTILGPTFIAASVFLVLPHAISVYGARACSIRPRFVGIAFASLILVVGIVETLGSVFAAFAVLDIGITTSAIILAVGLAIQAFALSLFVGMHFWITLGLSGGRSKLDPKHAAVYQSPRFKRFLFIIQAVAVLLLVHTCYRVVEMATGLGGTIFQNQTGFMVVNGAIPLLVSSLLAVFPPGLAFGKAWGPTSLRFRNKRFKRNLRPSPLPSPTSPYDRRRSPRYANFEGSSTGSPMAATPGPLYESTMASTVKTNPVTRTTTQPSPIATTQKQSPTFWRDHRQSMQSKASTSYQSTYSPKTSPTFQAGMHNPKQSPTFEADNIHQHVHPSQRPGGPATGRNGNGASGGLVDHESLW